MEAADLLKKVRKIEIKTKMLSNQVFAGEYHSAFKGRGMAFSEVREYQFGDDIKNIDWNVTARFNHPYIKIYEEERELTVMLLVDVSGSKDFGTQGQLKKDLMTELCAVLSFSAIYNNDKIGIIFFSNHVEKFIPPQKGKKHILRIISELLNFQAKNNGTNIGEALRFFTNVTKKRSTAFIISDFIDNDFEEAIKISSRKHDLIALHIFDQRETNMPIIGLACFKDAETGKIRWIDTSDKTIHNNYNNWWIQQNKQLNEIFLRYGIDSLKLRTDVDYVKPLMNFFKRRINKRI
ncbi:MAG: DUF58 domain-containing protein [Bacteroidetes bacterium CG23_combo_of_CG06-09_8_20_14_all_32_9]|nr:MAG: DUF58 domain-containing protein [Bacteroidetes bacterium CG23_combo_of_CG06-09_8_20_14_all_32_9]